MFKDTLLTAGFLDRLSSHDDKFSIDNALRSPSASRLPDLKDTNGDRVVEDNVEQAIDDESYCKQHLEVGPASENTIAEPHSQTIAACAEQAVTDGVPLTEHPTEGGLDPVNQSGTTGLAIMENAQPICVKEEPKHQTRAMNGLVFDSNDLVSDSFRLRRTSAVSSVLFDNTHPMSANSTQVSTSTDPYMRAPTPAELELSSDLKNHITMPSRHGKSVTSNADSAQDSMVGESPEAAKKRVESSSAEATKVTSHKPADEDQDRPRKRQRISIKALEAEDEEERRLEEQAEREGEELKRKKEEAEVCLQPILKPHLY